MIGDLDPPAAWTGQEFRSTTPSTIVFKQVGRSADCSKVDIKHLDHVVEAGETLDLRPATLSYCS